MRTMPVPHRRIAVSKLRFGSDRFLSQNVAAISVLGGLVESVSLSMSRHFLEPR